jgi:methionyl-tRNA formyltransferase
VRIALFGDGEWAARSLDRLIEVGHDIVAVILRARPSDGILEDRAHASGLPILQPSDVNTPECVASVRALVPDVNLSVAYNQIFRAAVRATAPWFLNVHAGKLPAYRGRNVINWAVINGEREIGITVHLVDEGIDTGDILLQRVLPIGWTDAYGDVLERVVREVPHLAVEAVALIAAGRAVRRPQPRDGTYYGGRRPGDEWLDWSQPSVDIYNKIRGIARPGPGARTWLGDGPVIIWRATYDQAWPRYRATPGEVVRRLPDRGVFVKTGDSTLFVDEVQLENAPCHAPAWPVGTRLGVDAGATLSALLARGALPRSPLTARAAGPGQSSSFPSHRSPHDT